MKKWQTYRIKDATKFISEKANDCSLPYIALDNIVSWDGVYIPSDSTSDGNSNACKKGDVLFGKLRPYLAKGFIPTQDSICSPEFIVLRPNYLINNKFLLYFLLSYSFINYIKNQVAGVKMPRTNALQIGRASLSLPPIVEQEAIVAYLDMECEKIGKGISLLERKADCYRRLKRSLINQAVIRGINPDVTMKPSGIPWIESIPEHWDIKRGKSILQEINRDVRSEDGIVTCFRDGEVTLRTNRRITGFTESEKEIGYHGVRVGDLVIHQMDAFAGAIGISDSDGKCSPICIVCRPLNEGKINLKYYCLLFRPDDGCCLLRGKDGMGQHLCLYATGIHSGRRCHTQLSRAAGQQSYYQELLHRRERETSCYTGGLPVGPAGAGSLFSRSICRCGSQ